LPLIVAANRDEAYQRPTQAAAFWSDHPHLLAGRDLEKGGTWMGVTTTGRFAALTNYRDPLTRKTSAPSRGLLVSGFLTGVSSSSDYLAALLPERHRYEDFNLVVGDGNALCYLGSRDERVHQLQPGIYGVSNHLMNTPWPKVTLAKQGFSALLNASRIAPDSLFALLMDRSIPLDHELPDTGVGIEWERQLGPIFIASPGYGTRSSTVVLLSADGWVDFQERRFGPNGEPQGRSELRFRINEGSSLYPSALASA
jgi:uncharacterized protein with NRDE domain